MKSILTVFILLFVTFIFVTTNPLYELLDQNCFVVEDENCPNKNVTFWLYKSEDRDTPVELNPLDLNPWQFKPSRPVKVLIHGYTGHRDFSPNIPIRNAFLDNVDYYVLSIDYGPLVRYPCYFSAVRNLPIASRCLAHLINNLVDLNIVENDDIHLIGFSLGAHVAGQTANYVKKPLKRITGLDPAKPLFITASLRRKLDASDAEFVDVIHTDVLGRGMLQSMGHVDFYPNIGPLQPGCQQENYNDPGSCNHNRATQFYAESINSATGFWGYYCPSWLHFTFGLCYPNDEQALMGYSVRHGTKGSYFLTTAAQSPFALGPIPYDKLSSELKHSLSYYNTEDVNDSSFEPQLRLDAVADDLKRRK